MKSGSGFFDAIMNMGAESTDAEPKPQEVSEPPQVSAEKTLSPEVAKAPKAPEAMETSKVVATPKPVLSLADFPVLSQDEATRLFRASCEVSRRVNAPSFNQESDSEFFARRGFAFSIDNPASHPRLKRGERPVRPAPVDPDAGLTASQRARRQIEEMEKARAALPTEAASAPQPAMADSMTTQAETPPAPIAPSLPDAQPVTQSELPSFLVEAPAIEPATFEAEPEPEAEPLAEAPDQVSLASVEVTVPEQEDVAAQESEPEVEAIAAQEDTIEEQEETPVVLEVPEIALEIPDEAQTPADEPAEIEAVPAMPEARPAAAEPAPLEWVAHEDAAEAQDEVEAELDEAVAEIVDQSKTATEEDAGEAPQDEPEPEPELAVQDDFVEAPIAVAARNVVSTSLTNAFAPTKTAAEAKQDDEIKEPGAWDLYEQKLRRL